MDHKSVHILSPYNSGSNFLASLVQLNGIRLASAALQTTLFKHYPPRLLLRIIECERITCEDILFLILVRDPFTWLQSMEKFPYDVGYTSLSSPCCVDLSGNNHGLTFRQHLYGLGFDTEEIKTYFEFTNIVNLWESFYHDCLNLPSSLSVKLVHYEDLLLRPAETVVSIWRALDMPDHATNRLTIPLYPAKLHGQPRNYLEARQSLMLSLTDADVCRQRRKIYKLFDAELLARLGYSSDFENFSLAQAV